MAPAKEFKHKIPIPTSSNRVINHIGALDCEQRRTIICIRPQIVTDTNKLSLIKRRPTRRQRLLHKLPSLQLRQSPPVRCASATSASNVTASAYAAFSDANDTTDNGRDTHAALFDTKRSIN